MTEPRKHHSVPRSLLRQFADSGEHLFTYDKTRRVSFPTSVGDAGAERDFYSALLGTTRLNWEPAFQELDDSFANVVRHLATASHMAEVSAALRAEIPLAVASQLLRTQMQRTSPADLARQLDAIGEPLGVESLAMTDTQSRLLHLSQLLGIPNRAAVLATKNVVLLISHEQDTPLWLSDNPVVLFNTFPYGRVGLNAPGIEVYLPISPSRCLALLCPSIGEQLRESFDPEHPRGSLAATFYKDLLGGLNDGKLVPVDNETVGFLNELQLAQSSRFLYSSQREFALADKVLGSRPELRHVLSLTTVGELGAAPPPLSRMPQGTFLLLEAGHRHHLIAVIDYTASHGRAGIAVLISDRIKYGLLEPNATYDCATLIIDGQTMRQMRNVDLVALKAKDTELVVVQHKDLALQFLLDSHEDQSPYT